MSKAEEKHSHYKKDVKALDMIDVYRVLKLWNVTEPARQHAIKKLLLAGLRGAKDLKKDLTEAIDSIERELAMIEEDASTALEVTDSSSKATVALDEAGERFYIDGGLYDWRKVPERFKWCAMDHGGRIYGYERKPKTGHEGKWICMDGDYEIIRDHSLHGVFWKDSLEERP